MNALAVMGGTFDPVHFGHLRSAQAAKEYLAVPLLKLVPSFIPPHRDAPHCSAQQRLEMLEIAVSTLPGIEVDDREIIRAGKSYTVDTLRSIRQEVGEQVPVYFILGIDSYMTLPEWQDWQCLTQNAHLLVLDRPGHSSTIPQALSAWETGKITTDLAKVKSQAQGAIMHVELGQIDISATQLRASFRAGVGPAGRMPETVIDYIFTNKLYVD